MNRRCDLRAVIFDWAGTLVDFGCVAPVAAFVQAFAEARVGITAHEARGPMGLRKIDHVRALLQSEAVRERWHRTHRRLPDEDDVVRLYARIEPLLVQVVPQHAEPIPGAGQLLDELRRQGVRIGSCTGYSAEIMAALRPEAERRGCSPELVVCASEVPTGRPSPWMCFLNALKLDSYPPHCLVKVGDTTADVEEGLNAGMWVVAFTRCGNEVGLSRAELEALPAEEAAGRTEAAARKLLEAGAHYAVEGPWECLPVIDELRRRIREGERP